MQALTLFLDLEPEEKADLATVARAALAFNAAIREAAFVLDPSLEIEVQFDSGTPGSLKLNAILGDAKKKLTDPKVLKAVAFVILSWFAEDVRSTIDQGFIQSIMLHEDTNPHLSDEEIAEIARKVAELIRGGTAHNQVKQVYRELEADPKIKGVGATTRRDHRPETIVPRSRFRELGTTESVQSTETGAVRRREKIETLNLISPVLLPGQRRWKFSFHEGEFGAPVLDQEFLDRVLSGREPIAMTAGLTMDVVLETKEELIAGVWAITGRNILRVLAIRRAPAQQILNLTPLATQQKSYGDEGK